MLESTLPAETIVSEPELSEKQLERVRSSLSSFYGYHQGPLPRIGTRVRNRRHGIGTVVAHARNDQVYVLYDNGGRDRRHMTEFAQSGEPRWPLQNLLRWFTAESSASYDPICIAQLTNHFRGDNGSRYANRSAYLWCVEALCHLGCLGPETPKLAVWLKQEIEAGDADDRATMPLPMDAKRIEGCAHDPSLGSLDVFRLAGAAQALLAAMDLGRDSIELSASDNEQEFEVDVEGLERCLAIDIAEERQVVILGRAQTTPGTGLVDVVDLDSLASYTRHISGLDIGGDAMDPGWFWDVITQSSLKYPAGATVSWWGSNLQGPQGIDVDASERRRVAVLAALILMRYARIARRNSGVKRHLKRARDLSRTLDKDDRRRLAAVAPELVAPETNNVLRVSPIDVIGQHLKIAVQLMLDVLPVPEAPPLELAPPSVGQPASQDGRPDQEVGPDLVLVKEASQQAREKISFTPSAKALRFKVSEYLLLAMEWPLVEEANAYSAAVSTSLEWLEQRLGTSLPKHWREGAHEIERAGVSLQIEASPLLFAFRLEHPDMEHPTRWWRVEVTVVQGRKGQGGMVGLRMQVRDLVDLPAPARTMPALVRAWASKPGLNLAGARAGNIAQIRTDIELERLHRIIHRRGRESPIWVVPAGGVRLPLQGPLAGLGRAVIVDARLAGYAERYGALTPNAIHIFAPHVTLPKRFEADGPDWLDQLRSLTLDMRHNPQTPSFRDVRDAIYAYRIERAAIAPTSTGQAWLVEESVIAEPEALQVSAAAPDSIPSPLSSEINGPDESAGISDDQIDTEATTDQDLPPDDFELHVRRELREFEELLELAETERDKAMAERDAAQAEAMSLRYALDRRRQASIDQVRAEPPVLPESLAEIASWAPSIAPRVVIADKALRFAAKVQHNEVSKIYASLRSLADLYWVMRFSDDEEERDGAKEGWKKFLLSNRLRWSPVGKAAQTGRYEDEYTAIVNGDSYTASWHVAGNSTHEPQRCLRIYLDVDAESQRLVVTHLPTHLTNSLT